MTDAAPDTPSRQRRPGTLRIPILLAALVALLGASLFPGAARAQTDVEVVFSSPPSPVGSGARAAGVGSAFIGLADDATAASWNPSGLTQLDRPELSVVGRGIWQVDQIGSGTLEANVNGTDQVYTADGQRDDFESIGLNYLSAVFPVTVAGRNLVFSVNYQQMLSFERVLHFHQTNSLPDGTFFTSAFDHIRQTGGIDAATLATAVEIVPDLSLGAAFNYWVDDLGNGYAWQQTYTIDGTLNIPDGTASGMIVPIGGVTIDTFRDFEGVNGTFGLLWKAAPNVSIGAVYKMPFTAHVDHLSTSVGSSEILAQRHRMQFPASYGVGVSYRPEDRVTLSMDVTYVDWNHFRAVDSGGTEFLVTGDPAGESNVDGIFTPRIGAEYLWFVPGFKVAARGGAFYDPEPARNSPKSFYGVSAGLGLTFPRFSLDFAYQLRFGLDLKNTATTVNLLDVPDVATDTFQNLFYGSIVAYF